MDLNFIDYYEFRDSLQIELSIVRLEENVGAFHPALGDMAGTARDNYSGATGHS